MTNPVDDVEATLELYRMREGADRLVLIDAYDAERAKLKGERERHAKEALSIRDKIAELQRQEQAELSAIRSINGRIGTVNQNISDLENPNSWQSRVKEAAE